MAKALFGHTTPFPDVRLLAEVGRLRRQVDELEQELADSRAERQRMSVALRAAEVQAARLRMELDDRPIGEPDLVSLSRLEHATR